MAYCWLKDRTSAAKVANVAKASGSGVRSRMFDDAEIDLTCPQCGHKSMKTIGWIKANDAFTCDGCCDCIQVLTAMSGVQQLAAA
jgi:hypothetical protein